ncbi:MAG: 50S ribosomal protein L9 [bacterium]
MKVILVKNVPKLGKAGEIKEISDGFARNMLFPKEMAVAATQEAIKALEFQKSLKRRKTEKELETVESIAEELDGKEFIIFQKAQEDGKLFGSVTEKVISERMRQEGFVVDKKQIKLLENIKNVGEHDITINFDHNLEAKIKIIVEAEE